jgi:hypothetical protein
MFNYKCKKNNRIEEGNSHRNIILHISVLGSRMTYVNFMYSNVDDLKNLLVANLPC